MFSAHYVLEKFLDFNPTILFNFQKESHLVLKHGRKNIEIKFEQPSWIAAADVYLTPSSTEIAALTSPASSACSAFDRARRPGIEEASE